MATIQIRDLALRAIIGIQEWEREKPQDLIINIKVEYDASRAAQTDDIADALDYKALKQKVVKLVEASRFNLVEKMAGEILKVIMEDPKACGASVTIDKPHALRFAKSVALTLSSQRI